MHQVWGAYALDVGCICTGCGVHMHSTRVHMRSVRNANVDVGTHIDRNELCATLSYDSTMFFRTGFTVRISDCILSVSKIVCCALPLVHMRSLTSAYAPTWGAYALELGCICTGVGVHMHSVWGAYAPAVGCTWCSHDKFSY